MRFLGSALEQPNGIALLQGPSGSGKTTVLRQQAGQCSRNTSVAFIDGRELAPARLVGSMLKQFGVEADTLYEERQLRALSAFLADATEQSFPPLLVIDDADRATQSALRLVNWLAALEQHGRFSLRLVLSGTERMARLAEQDSMRNLARRHPATYSLNPFGAMESMIYLRTRYKVSGATDGEELFPADVCDRLHELSRGWPGALNARAAELIDQVVAQRPVKPVPKIIVSCDGKTIAEHMLDRDNCVIGRSDLADIVVEDTYVSKVHAMLRVYPEFVVLVDLNSTNGTTVNSTLVAKTVLRNNDVIMLGRHRLKLVDAAPISPGLDRRIRATDTQTLKNLDDLRKKRARRTIAAMKQYGSA